MSNSLYIFDLKENSFVTEDMIKKSIIENFEISNFPFFDFCRENNKSILETKIFLDNINILNSIDDSYLCKYDYSYKIDYDEYMENEFLNYQYLNGSLLEYSVKTNNIKLMEWILFNRFNDIKNLCYFAVSNNNLEMLRFFRERNEPYPWDESCCCQAISKNNLEILKYLRSFNNPCPWDKTCTRKASTINNLEMLRFLREGNDPCPWDDWCCCDAISKNNLEMLKFLREGNDPCPWNKEYCIKCSTRFKDGKILDWIMEQK